MSFSGGSKVTASQLNNQAMQLVQNIVLGSSQPSVSFNPIAASFNHLRLLWHVRTTSGNVVDNVTMQFAGDSGNNYDWQIMAGLNATVSTTPSLGASSILVGSGVGGAGSANFFSNGEVDVLGWSQSSATHVVTVTGKWYACWSNSAATSQVGTMGGLYTPSAQVTSLSLAPAAGSFAAGCVFSLYGLN